MSEPARSPRGPGRWAAALDRAGVALLVTIVGIVLGLQYLMPNKRVLPVLLAILLFGLAWRADMATAIGLVLIALPFPRYTSFGNTNLAFVLFLLVIWLLRVSTRQTPPPTGTPANVPLVALFVCYVLSFYNVAPEALSGNLQMFAMMVACWLMFFMIAGNLREQRSFELVFAFQAVSTFTVCLGALFEVTHPGVNMLQFLSAPLQSISTDRSLQNVRVGSVFFDYELLCEYCALNLLLIVFLFARARSLLPRLAYGGLLLFLAFVLFTTVTRGGVIAYTVGLIYLLWLVRRRLSFVRVIVLVALVVGSATAINFYVANFTQAGDLFERLSASQVKGGIPDSRAVVWPEAWERIFEHPLLGHGPLYSIVSGTARVYHWPHCLYLFVANNVGFVGLAVFLWFLGVLFWMVRPVTDDLRNGDYVGSYLLVARAQMVIFLVDEIKIEYLRNPIYEFQIWVMFGLMAAASLYVHSRGGGATSRQSPAVRP